MRAEEFLQTVRSILDKTGAPFAVISRVDVSLEFFGLMNDYMESVKSALKDLNLEIDHYTIKSVNVVTGGSTLALVLKGLDGNAFVDYLSDGLHNNLTIQEVYITRSPPIDGRFVEYMYVLIMAPLKTSWDEFKTLDHLVSNVAKLGYGVHTITTSDVGIIFVFKCDAVRADQESLAGESKS